MVVQGRLVHDSGASRRLDAEGAPGVRFTDLEVGPSLPLPPGGWACVSKLGRPPARATTRTEPGTHPVDVGSTCMAARAQARAAANATSGMGVCQRPSVGA